jgi:hypothetical protein
MVWRRLLGLFFLLLLVDGALRKWVFPSHANEVFFAKDGVLILVIFIFTFQYRFRLPVAAQRTALPSLLLAYAVWVALEAFNPAVPTVGVALLGIKSHLLYLALMVLAPAALDESRSRIERLAVAYLVLVVIPISALGIYQYFSPVVSWVNRYVGTEKGMEIATAGSGGHARVTGSFSYISGMVTFAVFNISLAGGLILAGLKRGGVVLWVGAVLLSLTLVVAPMTGSRGAIYVPAITLTLLSFQAARQGRLNVRVVGLLLFGVALGSFALGTRAASGWTSFSERAKGATDVPARIRDVFAGPVHRVEEGGLLGFGVGTAHQAAPRLVPGRRAFEWLPSREIEEENGRVALEIGAVGLVLYLLIKLRLCLIAFTAFSRARRPWEVCWSATAFLFMLGHVISGTVFNAVAGAIFWPLAGVAVAIWSRQVSASETSAVQQRHLNSVPAVATR